MKHHTSEYPKSKETQNDTKTWKVNLSKFTIIIGKIKSLNCITSNYLRSKRKIKDYSRKLKHRKDSLI